MKRHALIAGEHLAISPSSILRDDAGFFFLLGPSTPDNEPRGKVTVVHIRGAITQFSEDGGDSYEAIVRRVREAMSSDDTESVVLRISSPGGVVAGLNEAVLKLRKMSKESGIRLIAYVDEIAASAAYAICCSCEEIFGPPSAITGSVGVISTMVSEVGKDALEGREFKLITSGARKADGHLHGPITDGAVAAEEKRNAQLAQQFYGLVKQARGLSPKTLAGLEAAIYLTADAVKVGLADAVWGWDDVMAALGADGTTDLLGREGERGGNVTDRRAKEKQLDTPAHNESTSTADGTSPRSDGDGLMLKLDALIEKTEASIAGETDPKKKARLAAQLATYEATKRAMGSSDDDGADDDSDSDEDEEESKAAKAKTAEKRAAKKAEAAKHRAEAAKHKSKMAEYEEKAKKCEEDAKSAEEDDEEEEEEESEARTHGARDAALAEAGREAALASAEHLARIDALELKERKRDRQAMIDEALQKRRISPAEAKTLAKKDLGFVQGFLEMRPKAIVRADDQELEEPEAREGAELPPSALKEIDRAVSVFKTATNPKTGKTYTAEELATLRTSMIEENRKAMAETNGIGRY